MIKIIRPAKNDGQTVFRSECGYCGTVFEYEREDVRTGAYGCAFVECPHCGEEIDTSNEGCEKKLTQKNLVYPDDFFICKNAVEISDEKVRGMIDDCLTCMRNDGAESYTISAGNRTIGCYKLDDDTVEIHVLQPVAVTEIHLK